MRRLFSYVFGFFNDKNGLFFVNTVLKFTIAFVAVSCGKGRPNASALKNVPGEDSSLALLLGQGLNPVENKAKGHCVTLGALKTQSGNVTGETAEFRLLEITSESRLRESLNVSASASFGGL